MRSLPIGVVALVIFFGFGACVSGASALALLSPASALLKFYKPYSALEQMFPK
jgi:hypothetical protein